MFARLEEFDVLTPLQSTPAVSIASGAYVKNYGSSSPSTSSSSDSRIQLIPPVLTSSSSDSPPPPRRPNHGKTLIVPLNASRYRSPLTMNLVGTPDSRLTSFECGTTKSCATIPEDDEDEMDELLSIDRTSLSVYEPASGRFGYSAYNLCLPQPMPEFQSSSSGFSPMLPAPTYSPPSLPSESPASKPMKVPEALDNKEEEMDPDPVSVYEFSRISDPNSPHSSSNSISDSFYLNNFDVISSAANSQIFEASLCGESDVASKFQLHRIEEESENGDEMSGAGGAGGHEPQISSMTSSTSQFFPRIYPNIGPPTQCVLSFGPWRGGAEATPPGALESVDLPFALFTFLVFSTRSSAIMGDAVADALEKLSADQIEQFRKYFNMFDKEGKGYIRATQQLIKEFDADGSGEIEFEEFAAMVANFVVNNENDEGLEEELREAFRLYDKEGNGYINVSDLRDILRALDDNVSEEELDEMIAEIDADGSGTVDFDEFMEMMSGE
ncbi:unnamed protein product [Caenorhabditis sp. 36 PRJEB53466]|nr:unnamed protein product [Caenorhabditis sp. 36 PRJEB53466]